MPDERGFLTDDEKRRVAERAASLGGSVYEAHESPGKEFIDAHLDLVALTMNRLHQLGLLPYRDVPEALREMSAELFSYMLSVVELEVTEEERQAEFDLMFHVTVDTQLLAHADILEVAFGLRPVTLVEMDAIIDAKRAEQETEPC